MSSDSAPRIRVQLQLQTKDGHRKPNIIKCTSQGHEIVEEDGFIFVRKRKAPDAQSKPKQDNQPASPSAHASGEAQAGPGGQLEHQPQGTPSRVASASPLAAAAPGDADPTRSPLGKKPRVEGAAGVDTPPSTPAGAAAVGDQQHQEEQAATADAEQQCLPEAPSPSPLQPRQRPAPRERDLLAEVTGLTAFLPSQCPTALKVKWLLQQSLHLAVPPGDEAAAAAAESVLAAFERGLEQQVAAAQRLLQAGGAEELRQYDALPPMIREMCSGERVAASLRQQLAALEEEEAAWLELEAKYKGGGAAAAGAVAAGASDAGAAVGVADALANPDGPAVVAAGEGGKEGAAEGVAATAAAAEKLPEEASKEQEVPRVDLEAVVAAQQRADVQLEVQIDQVDCMLGRLELLLEQAHKTSATLQAEYHKENFVNQSTFAHVNSPARLVGFFSQQNRQPAPPLDFVPSTQPSQG